jgi:chemotaxis protein histidine kinase CheA
MNQNPPETPTRVPSDINNNAMQLTIPTVFLDKTAKAAAKQSKEEKFLQKKQDVKGSIANIIAILRIINTELQYEQDQETFTVLIQQKEVFEKILTQKQTEEKNSLRTVENEIISQLQNQIKNLEKSMENKFNLILKTIESKNQTQFQTQSQIQSQNQTENQSQNQSQNQLQNQTKTYAQIAAANAEEDNLQQTKKQQKQQEKEREKEKYREKRLIIQIEKETAEDFDSYILRNQINDRFFTEANIDQPVIATATKSFTSQSIILTTMPDFSADFLLQKKAIWENIFSSKAQNIEKDRQWSKVVVYGVPVRPFSMDEGLSLLKNEIETFNPGLKLLKNPIWLSSQENRQINRHATILIAVENAKQAQTAIENRLCIAGNWLIAEKCQNLLFKKQCLNCQRFDHSTRACFAQSICQICAEEHNTSQHNCNICNIQGQICPHAILKCSNCGENHSANSNTCEFKTSIENKTTKYSQQKSQQTKKQSFQVVINNAGKW